MLIVGHKILLYFMAVNDFKKNSPLGERLRESSRIITKFPNRVPVIILEKNPKETKIDKRKYLVPMDLTMGQFIYVIRKRIKFPPEKALFCFTGNFIPPTSASMSSLYYKHKDGDNFLYITISCENTFGMT